MALWGCSIHTLDFVTFVILCAAVATLGIPLLLVEGLIKLPAAPAKPTHHKPASQPGVINRVRGA